MSTYLASHLLDVARTVKARGENESSVQGRSEKLGIPPAKSGPYAGWLVSRFPGFSDFLEQSGEPVHIGQPRGETSMGGSDYCKNGNLVRHMVLDVARLLSQHLKVPISSTRLDLEESKALVIKCSSWDPGPQPSLPDWFL